MPRPTAPQKKNNSQKGMTVASSHTHPARRDETVQVRSWSKGIHMGVRVLTSLPNLHRIYRNVGGPER